MRRMLASRAFLFISLLPILVTSLPALSQVPGKTLIVVAHPDDEYYFAATVYRMAVQLRGDVDELIITDGEGGYRYSTLAEPYYGKNLTNETIGRQSLPAIRRREAVRAGRVLGIRHHYFLNQKDTAFTTDQSNGQKSGWNITLITGTISSLVKREHYRYIFCILPRTSMHGHHQETTELASTVIQALPTDARPALLGFDTDGRTFPSNETWPASYAYAFDRTTTFGFHDSLSYQIIVHWMIAEHKSQGLFQTMCGKDPREYIWVSSIDASPAASSLFRLLALPSSSLKGPR
ncbi:PIG-L family deacetylase [Silvibacterium acidisoli]|uniref:PIG-L family deacetylase n=1 Tax=Acidobacteriaceae bacterium ZG23-2 TaxID=2883246 RepID=UPI00406CA0FC